MRKLIITGAFFFAVSVQAQELYVYTEPASNMAAKSIGVRVDNMLMRDEHKDGITYNLSPEVMLGVSKKIMLHVSANFSNADGSFTANGAGVYLKYRFFSVDDVHDHFRMAAFGRLTYNNSFIHEYAVTLGRHNSGYEGGLIATRLMNKVALSASSSFVHAMDNGKRKFLFGDKLRNAAAYSLSAGKLMLPKEYTSYKQVNMNLMLELLGQTNLRNGYSYIDMAPSVQFIFNSRTRLDLGYRFALSGKLVRYSAQGGLVRLEYNFYNVIK